MEKTQWISGDWNAICDICGFQFKASELRENWKKQRVCKDDFETRHPQEFVRTRPETNTVPWSRPDDEQGVITLSYLIHNVPTFLTAVSDAQVYNYATGTIAGGAWPLTLPDANDATYGGISTSITVFIENSWTQVRKPCTVNVNTGTLRGSNQILPGQTARFVNYPATNTWQREV